ncbi:MAG: Alcohol dehydrogenase zinc-binding domain protein [Acidobacteria bacterium]|nr:Alcohol dehydrogenase zinc-binding domain protein [Acidobacteriota bacterium]
MKAHRLAGFTTLDDLRLPDEDVHGRAGEVLVPVYAVSSNFRDFAMLRGRYPVPRERRCDTCSRTPRCSSAGDDLADPRQRLSPNHLQHGLGITRTLHFDL